MKTPEQVQYQGQAKSVGFDPKDDGSSVPALAAELDRQLAGFKKVAADDIANQARYNQAVDSNRAFESSISAQNWKSLTNFSQSLSQLLTEETERKNESDLQEGVMQAYLDGIDPAESMAFDIAEGYLKDNDDQIQGIGDSAQATGAPFMGVQKIRELSGWKAYGYAMGMAQNVGASYGSAMTQALASVPEDATTAEKAALLSNARAQYLQQTGLVGMNPALLNKHAFPAMREADSAILNTWRKQEEDAIKSGYIDEAQTLIGADGVGNFPKALDLMVRGGMDRRKARNELLGMLDPDEVDGLGTTMSWDGKLTWEEKYPNDFRTARRNAVAGEVADYDSDQAAKSLEGREWFDDVQEKWKENPPNAEELDAVQRFMEDNFNYVDPRLDDRWKGRTTDAESKEYYTKQFQALDRAGMLTEAALNDPAVPYDVRERFLPKAQAQDKARTETPEFKQYNKEIESKLKAHSGQNALDEIGKEGLELAIVQAQSRFQQNMMAALNGGASSPAQAAQIAYAQFQQDIANSVNPEGLYYVDDLKGFVNILPKGYDTNWSKHKSAIDAVLDKNSVSALDKNALIPMATLEDAIQNSNRPGYQLPAIATSISNRFGGSVSPWAVLDRQAKARGLPGLVPNPRLQSQTQGIRPDLVRLLHYKPSYNRVARAYASTGSFNPDRVPNGYGSVILEAASANNVDPAILAGLIEVESNFNPKARSGAGAVGIAQIMPNYHPTVDPTKPTESIQYAAKYLKQLYDQLGNWDDAIYAYNGGPGGIRKSAENRAYQPKVMKAAAKYGYGSSGNPWTNPALLNPRLAYVTGNIGPTSTGPHLDVKQTDGKDFSSTALDRYVEVDDPEYGRVPLSRVGVTADAANHRRRGSHGIDYGTHSGSRVYLKGGAKVVGSVKTAHGDKVTIQLPSGQKYTFLHGRSA